MGIHESVKSRCKVRRIPVVDQQSTSGSSQTHFLELMGFKTEDHNEERSEASRFSNPFEAGPSIDAGLGSPERSEASRFINPFEAVPSIDAGLGSPIREEPSSYPSPVLQRSLPLDGCGSQNFNTQYEELFSSEDHNEVFTCGSQNFNTQYEELFSSEDHNELYLSAEEEFEIEYEVDSMYDD